MQSNMADSLHGELSDGTGASREIEAELRIHSNQGTAAMAGTRGYGDERAEDVGARLEEGARDAEELHGEFGSSQTGRACARDGDGARQEATRVDKAAEEKSEQGGAARSLP